MLIKIVLVALVLLEALELAPQNMFAGGVETKMAAL